MAQLGQAFLAINKDVLGMMVEKNFPLSAVSGPKIQMDGSVTPAATFGFQFAMDLQSLIGASQSTDAYLRIDLNEVLDIVDIIGCDVVAETGIEIIPGHDNFAFGVDPFQIEISAFEASRDGVSFAPAAHFNSKVAVIDEPADHIEVDLGTAAIAMASDPRETVMLNSDDAVMFDLNPPEEALIAALDAEKKAEVVKKIYSTPYIPRGQWLKMMREKGLLKPRQRQDTSSAVVKTTPADTVRPPKRTRTSDELRAIRRFYAVKKSA
jgi:hypothetical protein